MKNNSQKGQTLVILLTYMVIAIIVTTASIALIMNSAINTDKLYQGTTALDVAENGAENALIRMLREPGYLGEVLTTEGGSATVDVTGTNPKVITSRGTLNDFTRTIEVTVSTTNNVYVITSWKEL